MTTLETLTMNLSDTLTSFYHLDPQKESFSQVQSLTDNSKLECEESLEQLPSFDVTDDDHSSYQFSNHNKRKISFPYSQGCQKLRKTLRNVSTASSSNSINDQFDQNEQELEKLVNSITKEAVNVFVPMKLPFEINKNQETFLSQFISKDSLSKLKNGFTEDLLNGSETQDFKRWCEDLCDADGFKVITRREKVRKYLEKRSRKTFERKVHYKIRQKVAEERLRVKGRFVTQKQARNLLHDPTMKYMNNQKLNIIELKHMLNEKYTK